MSVPFFDEVVSKLHLGNLFRKEEEEIVMKPELPEVGMYCVFREGTGYKKVQQPEHPGTYTWIEHDKYTLIKDLSLIHI